MPPNWRLALNCTMALSVASGLWWKSTLVVVVLVWIVGYVNAFNFMDGIDGLAASQAIVAGSAYFVAGAVLDNPLVAAGGALLVGTANDLLTSTVDTAQDGIVVTVGTNGSVFVKTEAGTLTVGDLLVAQTDQPPTLTPASAHDRPIPDNTMRSHSHAVA